MDVQQREVPEAIRALSTMAPPDYVDLFTATAGRADDTSPEQWARAAMEGAPPAGRFLAWQALLGLRLDLTPSPARVGGWTIADRGDGWIRMEARSWFMTAHIVFRIEPAQVSFATFVRYDRRIAAVVWTPVSAIHRRVAPGFLAGAVRRIDRSRRAGGTDVQRMKGLAT